MPKKTSNDEKFVMNFFQKGNGNTQIASVNNFTAKDYMPDDEEESEETEELTEIEKAIQENNRRIINEQVGKRLKKEGYTAKTVGNFTFYIKTRAEYIKVLHKTLAFARGMAEGLVRDKDADKDFVEFITMTVLYLSDLLEEVETEEYRTKITKETEKE